MTVREIARLIAVLLLGALACHALHKRKAPEIPVSNGVIQISDRFPDETPVCFEKWNHSVEGMMSAEWRNCATLGRLRRYALPNVEVRNGQ